jgi:transposase-like protein
VQTCPDTVAIADPRTAAAEPVPRPPRQQRRPAISGVSCPSCGAEALYRYGKTGKGHPRCLCKVCGRQFGLRRERRIALSERPACLACGRPMHVYMRAPGIIRFRCSGYPSCRSFTVRRDPPAGSR